MVICRVSASIYFYWTMGNEKDWTKLWVSYELAFVRKLYKSLLFRLFITDCRAVRHSYTVIYRPIGTITNNWCILYEQLWRINAFITANNVGEDDQVIPNTRNISDCDQSIYSSRIILSYIPAKLLFHAGGLDNTFQRYIPSKFPRWRPMNKSPAITGHAGRHVKKQTI